MWEWLLKLLGLHSKTQCILARENQLLYPPTSTKYPVALDGYVRSEPETEIELPVKYDLYSALAKAKQEALEPILPEKFKEIINLVMTKCLPDMLKKKLMAKEDLILIGKCDLSNYCSEKFSNDDWHIIKSYSIRELNSNGIKAEASSGAEFIQCHVEDILNSIKDYKIPEEEKELPPMNTVGIYR